MLGLKLNHISKRGPSGHKFWLTFIIDILDIINFISGFNISISELYWYAFNIKQFGPWYVKVN